MTTFFEKIEELVQRTSLPNRHRARSAVHHIRKAEALKEIDKNMALFRLVTAEEEAATALFLTLKARKYEGAEDLKHWDHLFKNAVYPFFRSLQMVFTELNLQRLKPNLQIINVNGKDVVNIKILSPFEDPPKHTITSDPPLDFQVQNNAGEFLDLKPFYTKLVGEKKYKDVIKWLEEEANFRNRLLYASDDGIPHIAGNIEGEIRRRTGRVSLILSVYLMIEPYKQRQMFVQSCLKEFLKMVRRVPKEKRNKLAQ